MGAAKPGSTLPPQGGMPPQGGKGGGRPMPMPPQGGKGGVQQPGFPQQPQVPAQGGKAPLPRGVGDVFPTPQVQQPGQVPAQGGKGRDFGPNVFPGPQVQPPYTPIGPGSSGPGAPPPSYIADKYAEMERMRAGQPQQPGQVPAQGGKAPLTPEQQAALGPYINPARPMPQVSPPQGGFPQQTGQVPDYMRPFISNLPQKPGTPAQSAVPGLQDAIRGAFLNAAPGSPTGYPTQPAPVQPQVQQRLSDMPQIQAAYGQPQVMPKPVPQVMPRGLAGLRRR
jgi:hypothetical protein